MEWKDELKKDFKSHQDASYAKPFDAYEYAKSIFDGMHLTEDQRIACARISASVAAVAVARSKEAAAG